MSSGDDVLALLRVANIRRSTKKTRVNERSSRSHLVFTLRLANQTALWNHVVSDLHLDVVRLDMKNGRTAEERNGVLHLVDLAVGPLLA